MFPGDPPAVPAKVTKGFSIGAVSGFYFLELFHGLFSGVLPAVPCNVIPGVAP